MLLPYFFLFAAVLQPVIPTDPSYRQPQLAAAEGQVAMVFGAGRSVYFSDSPDGGVTFSAPVKVADTGVLMLGRHRGPRLAILKDSLVISAVVDGDLRTWRSTDRGSNWSAGAPINDLPNSAREGLHAMASLPGGGLFAVWLDMRAKGTRLYGATSADGGKTWSKNELVYESPGGTICTCCHPSLAVDGDGRISVMFRNALDGSRDLYLVSSKDGRRFETAQKVGAGTWKLQACPMDGGGVSVLDGHIVTAWRRESDIFLAQPSQAEVRIGPGKDVAVAQTKDGIYIVYTIDGAVEAVLPGTSKRRRIAAEGAFPSLVTLAGRQVLAAWETKTGIEWTRLP